MGSLAVDTGIGIPVPHGATLASDLIRPAGPGRYPAVLMRTAYDRTTHASVSLQVHALRLAAAGYAVVLQDVRGRGASTGDFVPFTSEQADGLASIEWIAGQPWCNGSVAMGGISYNAFCQLAAAAAAPEPLAAWVPGLSPFDVRTSWIREGGALNYGFHLAWGLGAVLPGDPRTHDVERATRAFASPLATARRGVTGQEELAQGPGTWFREWAADADPYPGDARVPTRGDLGGVSAPALVVAGWHDIFQAGTFELYESLCRETERTHGLIVGPWDHTGLPLSRRVGDMDFGTAALSDLHELQLQWFDCHLRGASEPQARIRVFVTGRNDWLSLARWPPPSNQTSWYPSADGVLARTETGEQEMTVDLDHSDPTPALGGRVYPWEPVLRPGVVEQSRRRNRTDVAAFASEPLAAPFLAMGPVEFELVVAAPAGGTDVVTTLIDVDPEGRAHNVADGVSRAPLPIGESASVRVSLGQIAHRFGVGHRIGLDVSCAAFPRYDLAFRPGRRTLHVGGGRAVLLLPQVEE